MYTKNTRRILLSCVSSLAITPFVAAQETEEEDAADEIVVQGFRSSLENSVSTKRDNQSIVEAISAEEIGKLPDISIAESLGRLPGIATQRVNGRSSVLSIRGLGPDFSTALLNGREQVTTNDNRGVEFDQYPAELLGSAVVYKTPFAGLIGQAFAGTVDLRTVRPLDKADRVISFSGRYEFNETEALNPDSSNSGFRSTATIIDQFADDTWGVALGVAYQQSPQQLEAFNAWGYAGGGTDADPLLIGGSNGRNGLSNELDRVGGFFTLQYEPDDQFSSIIDIFYTDFNENQASRGIETPLGFGGGFGVVNGPVTATQNGFATAGSFDNVRGVVRNDFNERRAELFSAGWNGKYDSDTWGVELDFSYSRATRRDRLIESYSGTGFGSSGGAADTIAFTQEPGQPPIFSLGLDYADPANLVLTDPLGWGGGSDVVQAGFINAPDTDDQLWHLRAAVDRDVDYSVLSNVQLGFDWGTREKERQIIQQFLTLPGGPTLLSEGAVTEAAIPAQFLLDEPFTGAGFLGFGPQVAYDPRALVDNFYVPVSVALSSFAQPQDWVVREDVLTGWIKFGLDGNVGSVPLTGNFGLQVVHTDQESEGSRVSPGGATSGVLDGGFIPITDGDSYTQFLPSANLIFSLGESTFLRVGASRSIARPRLDQLNASLSLTDNSATGRLDATFEEIIADPENTPFIFAASGGNPRLRPYIANQADLSIEHYFGGASYIALAGYYKDINDFVNPSDGFLTDFTDIAQQELTPEEFAQLGNTLGPVSGPTNDGDGRILGVELTISLDIGEFVPFLDGFGLITSPSFVDSETELFFADPATGEEIRTDPFPIPGLSEWVVNSTLYYEKYGFEGRVSHRYRSAFLAEVSGISATRVIRQSGAESIIDAQIGYAFSGPLEGLRITAQGLNLTDENFRTFNDLEQIQLIDDQRFGRTFLLGASYTF